MIVLNDSQKEWKKQYATVGNIFTNCHDNNQIHFEIVPN